MSKFINYSLNIIMRASCFFFLRIRDVGIELFSNPPAHCGYRTVQLHACTQTKNYPGQIRPIYTPPIVANFQSNLIGSGSIQQKTQPISASFNQWQSRKIALLYLFPLPVSEFLPHNVREYRERASRFRVSPSTSENIYI